MSQYRKNGKIDFLKFIFSLVIVMHHGAQKVLGLKAGFFIGGSLAVEFFFIVSGYLLMASISRMPERTLPLGVETRNFVLRKFKSFYPEIALCFILGFFLEFYTSNLTLSALWQRTFQSAFLINMSGIGVLITHGELWYISSMLLCMAILYPLIRKYPEMMKNVVLPLTALLILGYFCINKTHPRSPTTVWNEFTFKGNLRAMAELSIGVFLYPLAQKLKQIKFSTFGRVLLTVAEWGCYIAFYLYMQNKTATRLDYYYIGVVSLAILLTFSEQSIDTSWFCNRFFYFLGKVSFPVYLAHNSWAKVMNGILPESFSDKKRFVIYLALAFVSTVMIMVLSALLRKLGKVLKEPAKKLFLAKQEEPAEI